MPGRTLLVASFTTPAMVPFCCCAVALTAISRISNTAPSVCTAAETHDLQHPRRTTTEPPRATATPFSGVISAPTCVGAAQVRGLYVEVNGCQFGKLRAGISPVNGRT